MSRAPGPHAAGKKVFFVAALQALACAALLLPGAVHADATLDEARRLLEHKAAEQAYQLLAPLEEPRAGDPEFDLLLGRAALDSGRTTRAIFALERVLTEQPNHTQARAELARAYFLIGENQAAQHTFNQVLQQNPPAEIRATIARYLNAIEQRFNTQRDQLSGYLELNTGYDTNVNSATSDDLVAVPALGNLTFKLDPGGLEQADGFASLRGGINYRRNLRNDLQLFMGGSADSRNNFSHSRFNIHTLDAHTGLRRQRGKDRYTAAVQGQGIWLDDAQYRNLLGLNLQWERTVDARNQGSLFLHYATLRHPEQKTRDVNQAILGAAWVHALQQATPVVIHAGLFGGADDEQEENQLQVGRSFWGLRAGGNYAFNQKTSLDLNGSYQDARHDGKDPMFLMTRHDRLYDLTATVTHKIDPAWSLRSQLRHTANDSNVPIAEYQRTQLTLGLRHDFR